MKNQAIGHVIAGEMDYSGDTFAVYNKYTNEPLATVHCASKEVVKRAVDNAIYTFENKQLPATKRYTILQKAAEIITHRKEELALSIDREVGKTLKDAYVEIERAIETFTISAEEARRISGEGVPMPSTSIEENRMA